MYDLIYEWKVYHSERTFEQIGWNKGESISSCRFGIEENPWNLCFYPQGIGKRKISNPVLWLCRQRVGIFLNLEGTLTLITLETEDSEDETIAINTSMYELSTFVKVPLHFARKWVRLNKGYLTIRLRISVTEVNTSESYTVPFLISNRDEAEQQTWRRTEDRVTNLETSNWRVRRPQNDSEFVRVPRNLTNDYDSDWKPRTFERHLRAVEPRNDPEFDRRPAKPPNDSESEIPKVSDKLVSATEVKALCNLSRDMQTMYERKDLSDFLLKCHTTEFQVHKCVLSARSPVFASMFQHPVTENTENRVTITDIDACVLQQLIMFVYTGKTNALSYSMSRDLYSAADKYAILELKEICSQFIASSLTTSTAVEILILADMHNDALLKSTAIKLISDNFEDFNTTKAWFSLLQEHPSLGIEVLSFTVTQLKLTKKSSK
ncbi:Speckle-type POZ protein, partial [Stegodyphus mimosarum]